MTTSRSEEVFVLFGSQRGTSEDAATDFFNKISDCLSRDAIAKISGTDAANAVSPKLMSLDDFLLLKQKDWPRLLVIFVSSFGVGHAPRGAKKFRNQCDAWIEELKDQPDKPKPLAGVRFALCGLGHSCYSSFMMNPNKISEGLTVAGAEMVGAQGVADEDGGRDGQSKAISEWIDSIWMPLTEVLIQAGTISRQTVDYILTRTP